MLTFQFFVTGAFGFQRNSSQPGSRKIVTTGSHETEIVREAVAACNPTEVLKIGGAGHKVRAP